MLYKKDHVRGGDPFIYDIYLQKFELPERTTISACPEAMIRADWLFVDMMRFYKMSVTPAMGQEYLIIAKDHGCTVPEGYQKIHRQPTRRYILYQKKRPKNHQKKSQENRTVTN
jgi:hypothetical protein